MIAQARTLHRIGQIRFGSNTASQDAPVVRLRYVTGEADWVLVLRLASMEAYEAFTRTLLLADANVRALRTLVAMREVIGEMDARPLGLPG